MDPGTAAILTLSTITGISGYGAMKLNAKRGASIDEEVKKAIGDAQAMIKSAQDAKIIAEQERNKKEEEVKKLTAEIATMQKARQQLESEKDVLSKNLESATELEKTYRALSPEVFKQAIQDFMEKPEIKKLEHPELFEPLLSRYSVTRGTARTLYTKFANVVDGMIPKAEFDTLLLDTLKNADRSLEQTRLKQAETARLAKEETDKAAAEAKAVKDKAAADAKKIKDDAAAEAAALKAVKDARTLQQIVDEAFEAAKLGPLTSNTLYQSIKTPFLKGVDSVAQGAKQVATKTGEVLRKPLTQYEERQKRYKEALQQQGGAGDTFDTDVYYRLFHPQDEDRPNRTLADLFKRTSDNDTAKNMLPVFDAFMFWRSTVLKYPLLYKVELVASAENLFKTIVPSEVNRVFQNKELNKLLDASNIRISPNPMTTPTTGGMRKKKLRTRREGKQNVRRTRRSKNRPNRSDTYSSRRSEVDASRDELGL
jgi:myosin heavy subunit